MIKALKEYKNDVLKPSMAWIKRHWIGYLVFLVICFIGSFGWSMMYWQKHTRHIEEEEYYEDRYGKEEES